MFLLDSVDRQTSVEFHCPDFTVSVCYYDLHNSFSLKLFESSGTLCSCYVLLIEKDQQNFSLLIVLYLSSVIISIKIPVCRCLKLVLVCSCQAQLINKDLLNFSFLIKLYLFPVIISKIIPVCSCLKLEAMCSS